MLAILAPGQGAQSPGFLQPWLHLPPYADRLGDLLSAVPGLPAEPDAAPVLEDTSLLQPLLVAAGLAAAALLPEPDPSEVVAAGHSVGELSAVALAGVVDRHEAVALAATRGQAMAQAATASPGGMAAVVGPGDAVDRAVSDWTARGLTVANRNGAGQVVLAGPSARVQVLLDSPPAGVRTVRLTVAGAFHTQLMRPVVATVREALERLTPADPRWPVLSCLDGRARRDGQEVLSLLPQQVVGCVRWDLCQRTLRDLGVTGVLELPPGSTLTALARRELPGVERFALDSPDALSQARDFVRRHA